MNTSTKKRGIIILLLALLALSGVIVPATLADEPSDDLEVLRQAAENYFPYESRQYRISADDLYSLLHDGDPSSDPLVVSVQTKEQYEISMDNHLPIHQNDTNQAIITTMQNTSNGIPWIKTLPTLNPSNPHS